MHRNREALFQAALLGCALGLFTGGCDRGQRNVPPAPGGMPGLAGGEQKSTTQLTHAPSAAAQAMPADHPTTLQGQGPEHGALPPGHPPVGAEGAAPKGGGGGVLSGSLRIAPALKDKAPAGRTIFMVARAAREDGAPGPVLAVKKLTVGAWPQPFELTGADAMMGQESLTGKVQLQARVDQDGDAMTKQVGDVEGVVKAVQVGSKDVALTFDTVRAENAGAPLNLGPPAGHP